MCYCNGSYKTGRGLKFITRSQVAIGNYLICTAKHLIWWLWTSRISTTVRLGDKRIRIKGQPRVQEIGMKSRGKRRGRRRKPQEGKNKAPPKSINWHKDSLGEETESINRQKDSLGEETRNRRDGQDRTKQRGSFKASFRKTRATNGLKSRLRKIETGHKGLVEGKNRGNCKTRGIKGRDTWREK